MLDENDNAPKFIRMVVLPDQGVRVSQEPEAAAKDEAEDENAQANDSAASGRRSPLLLVPENTTIGAPIIRLLADDKDEGANAAITYSLGNETASGRSRRYDATSRRYFHLDPRTAEISVARSLPPEKDFRLFVLAKDPGGLSDNITVRIHVTDVNDHAPVFDKSWYTFDVAEGTHDEMTVGAIRALDADYGENAELSYELVTSHEDSGLASLGNASRSFSVDPYQGVIRVSGALDRERMTTHRLLVVARDHGSPSLSSSVEVEINVLDVNDNAPMFHGYDELEEGAARLPVYRASVLESSPIGTQVTRVHANDSDFAGNGNGLILFDLSYQDRAEKQYFAVDSKEGVVTTIAKLDYETKRSHRLIVTASDLGSPVSLTSSAVVLVTVLNVDDDDEDAAGGQQADHELHKMPAFRHRYYELEVEENATVPLLVVQLELAEDYRGDHIRYSVVADGSDGRDHFSVDPKNGSLYLMTEVDRETRERYEAKVRVDRLKIGRGIPVMIYPVTGERLNGLAPNEARVVVRVKDVNDNAPRFKSKGRPILAAIPTTAHYGYEVVKVEVRMYVCTYVCVCECTCMYARGCDSKRVSLIHFGFYSLRSPPALCSRLFALSLSFSLSLCSSQLDLICRDYSSPAIFFTVRGTVTINRHLAETR